MEALMELETERLIKLLRASLRILGLSHREIARRMGVSPSYLSKLFSGVSDMRIDHLVRICQAADLEPAEFFSLAYPRSPGVGSPAARRLRELLQSVELQPPPAAKPALELREQEVEELLKAMLEKLLERSRKSA
jgi:transcriptional regulator with XRE-family HTH domain